MMNVSLSVTQRLLCGLSRPCLEAVRPICRTIVILAGVILGIGVGLGSIAAADNSSSFSQSMIVVVGAGGNPQYEISFYQWSERWVAAAKRAGVAVTVIGRHRGEDKIEVTDYQRFRDAIQQAEADVTNPLWIVMIGHGTFDRRIAKFNLRGPDVSSSELAEWLKTVQRPIAVINCSSASGAFIPKLSGANRVVVSATKAGTEINFSRFGDHLSKAIVDPAADLDKDHQISLWEAFLMASRKTIEYYEAEGRVVTEHALLDDNGDGQGVRADQFIGLTPITKSANGLALDGRRAHQWHLVPNEADAKLSAEVRGKRNEIEIAIDELRDRKDSMPTDVYFRNLEPLLLKLAELNESLDQ